LCITDTFQIHLPENITSVSWLPVQSVNLENRMLKFYPTQSTAYNLNFIFNLSCIINRTLNVVSKVCPETIFFPNSFTPNTDGINEAFKPWVSLPLTHYSLSIFNRYGQKVFETTIQQNGWNGYYKNSPQPLGAYMWQTIYQFGNKSIKRQKGYVLLIR
jgi:gliding motility-associated-like protein